MINEKVRERWSNKVVIIITTLFSLLLLVIGFIVGGKYQDTKSILISVACSVLASNLIMYLTSAIMLRSQRRSEIIDHWGLEAIFLTRAEMNVSSNIALERCNGSIEFIAFGLKGFRDSKTEEVQRLLNKGVSIKILTLSPHSQMLKYVDLREDVAPNSTKHSIEKLFEWAEKINKISAGSKIEIKTYDLLPLDFYLRVDDRVYIGPYLYGKSSQQIISYEFSSGAGYNYWTKYFTSQWEKAA